jgi:hypothetical protein
MYYQQTLFEIDKYDISAKLAALEKAIEYSNFNIFSVDKIQKASKIYGLSCEMIWKVYKKQVTYEKFSDHTTD